MNASIVDLRYKMSEVLDALARRERVNHLLPRKGQVLSPIFAKKKILDNKNNMSYKVINPNPPFLKSY